MCRIAAARAVQHEGYIAGYSVPGAVQHVCAGEGAFLGTLGGADFVAAHAQHVRLYGFLSMNVCLQVVFGS
jgi:hypothetical protein